MEQTPYFQNNTILCILWHHSALGRHLLGIELFCNKSIHGWRGSQLTSARCLVLRKDFLWGQCQPSSCARAAENENKESSISLQLLVFRRKFHCAWEARQSYRCPATLYTHPGWQTFSQLMRKARCSYFPSMWNNKQVSFLRKKEPQLCCQKKAVLSKTWWFKVEFLFRLTSLCRFFSGAVCLPKGKLKSFSHVQLFAASWTVAHQAPPSVEFSRQEYWSGLPFPSPGDLPDAGTEPRSPALQANALPSEPLGNQISY